jgi:hypothetical protein
LAVVDPVSANLPHAPLGDVIRVDIL